MYEGKTLEKLTVAAYEESPDETLSILGIFGEVQTSSGLNSETRIRAQHAGKTDDGYLLFDKEEKLNECFR